MRGISPPSGLQTKFADIDVLCVFFRAGRAQNKRAVALWPRLFFVALICLEVLLSRYKLILEEWYQHDNEEKHA